MSLKERLKILVVDDMSTSRGLILQALETMGVQHVLTATNGQSALALLANHPIHLILSDFHMPDMNGITLLRSIRADDLHHDIGFILVTGRSGPEIVNEVGRLGLNNLLRKPFTPADLRAAIEAVVGPL